MDKTKNYHSRIDGLRNLDTADRLSAVARATGSSHEDISSLSMKASLPEGVANGMIENVVGTFELPLGIATNFVVNGKDYLVPMAVEEPSVVAAASYMAKIVAENGGFQSSATDPIMRAQVQLLGLTDTSVAKQSLLSACLLYTSPSPRDQRGSRMPSSA